MCENPSPTGVVDVHVRVLLHLPAYGELPDVLTYLYDRPLPPGTLVRVPLGTRNVLGIAWDDDPTQAPPDRSRLRPIAHVFDAIPPLADAWRKLVRFSAAYYQRSIGEVALGALPPKLRELDASPNARKRRSLALSAAAPAPAAKSAAELADNLAEGLAPEFDVALTDEQRHAIAQYHAHSGPFLLFGVTGSGKTEVFLRCTLDTLCADPTAQVLVMVPEINLTPQLEERFRARFCPRFGDGAVVSLHSGLSPVRRLQNWLAAHHGAARIVLGTRMAVFASIPQLRLIVVDEEHDPSYKSQDGARHSARDLAVYRGAIEPAKVLLGSATPSLESWHQCRPPEQGGRYLRIDMPNRVGALRNPGAGLPVVRTIDMGQQPRGCVIALPLLQAIEERIARGEQSLLLLNRRGYAPVLQCTNCDWKSQCPHCSVFRVFHKSDRTLRCHHCGCTERVPRTCPQCGHLDITPVGRGTERLEEQVQELLAGLTRPDGSTVCIERIDADTTRRKGALEERLLRVHSGAVDVLVGTQMIAKGHDFRHITLVAALHGDTALYSSDFRASERLFALLMQAAGRAGRNSDAPHPSEVWVQTFSPDHPLFAALQRHDYAAFANAQLAERRRAGLPPFAHQALVRAEARTQEAAQAFLRTARDACNDLPPALLHAVTLYPAVPMSVARIANVERAQMLIESPRRSALQRFLTAWHPLAHAAHRHPGCKGLLRWAVDVDPVQI
ncbi:replication restart helicase PriA [Candidatus Symbiobacter mobilis]|uniref:Replication restart protein PriA n=1 Tax=Candidatus Symbiobacter mobilis CR TaxID=946483 RepID=U5NAM5_9BURK|nr:primosomal protein N' [Candidatus Symbiobacter mobilis]AGX87313.1 primosomal protein N' [Candidatus Symbiobacter mobilis CR]